MTDDDERHTLCACGAKADEGSYRARCHECSEVFVPEPCPVCARRALLVSVDGKRMCADCSDAWRGEP